MPQSVQVIKNRPYWFIPVQTLNKLRGVYQCIILSSKQWNVSVLVIAHRVGETQFQQGWRKCSTRLTGTTESSRSFRGDGPKYTEGLLILSVHGKEQRNRYSRITTLYCNTYSTDESWTNAMIEQPSSTEQVLLEQTSTDTFESWDKWRYKY